MKNPFAPTNDIKRISHPVSDGRFLPATLFGKVRELASNNVFAGEFALFEVGLRVLLEPDFFRLYKDLFFSCKIIHYERRGRFCTQHPYVNDYFCMIQVFCELIKPAFVTVCWV